MSLKVRILIVLIALLVYSTVASGEDNRASYGSDYSRSGSFTGYNEDYWQPQGSASAGAGGSIKAKVSCTDIDFKFDINTMNKKLIEYLRAILLNPNTKIVNAMVKTTGRFWAISDCGGGFSEMAQEYPEQVKKLWSCFEKNMGDTLKNQTGQAVGTATFTEVKVETNPGTASKISACVTDELADEMGESYRSCVERSTKENIDTIRQMLEFYKKMDFQYKQLMRDDCILNQRQKEMDLVKANEEYGTFTSPDGTTLKCRNGECKPIKVAVSAYALTVEDDLSIDQFLAGFLKERITESKLTDIKKGAVYALVFNWFDKNITNSNSWQTKMECDDLKFKSKESLLFGDPSRIMYGEDPEFLHDIFIKDQIAIAETSEVIKKVCGLYDEAANNRILIKRSESISPAFASKSQRETYALGQYKSEIDYSFINASYNAKEGLIKANERARESAKRKSHQSIDEAIKKINEDD